MEPLLPQELLELRQQMYEAHGDYIVAWKYFCAIQWGDTDATLGDRTLAAAKDCRTTGVLFNGTLMALIDFLEPMQSHPNRAAELKRAKTFQGTLSRELALIQRETSRHAYNVRGNEDNMA